MSSSSSSSSSSFSVFEELWSFLQKNKTKSKKFLEVAKKKVQGKFAFGPYLSEEVCQKINQEREKREAEPKQVGPYLLVRVKSFNRLWFSYVDRCLKYITKTYQPIFSFDNQGEFVFLFSTKESPHKTHLSSLVCSTISAYINQHMMQGQFENEIRIFIDSFSSWDTFQEGVAAMMVLMYQLGQKGFENAYQSFLHSKRFDSDLTKERIAEAQTKLQKLQLVKGDSYDLKKIQECEHGLFLHTDKNKNVVFFKDVHPLFVLLDFALDCSKQPLSQSKPVDFAFDPVFISNCNGYDAYGNVLMESWY